MDKVTIGTLNIAGELGIDPAELVEILKENREHVPNYRKVIDGLMSAHAFAQELAELV